MFQGDYLILQVRWQHIFSCRMVYFVYPFTVVQTDTSFSCNLTNWKDTVLVQKHQLKKDISIYNYNNWIICSCNMLFFLHDYNYIKLMNIKLFRYSKIFIFFKQIWIWDRWKMRYTAYNPFNPNTLSGYQPAVTFEAG